MGLSFKMKILQGLDLFTEEWANNPVEKPSVLSKRLKNTYSQFTDFRAQGVRHTHMKTKWTED